MKATTTGSFQSHPYIPTKVIIEIELDRQQKCLPCPAKMFALPLRNLTSLPPSSSLISFFENIGRQRQTVAPAFDRRSMYVWPATPIAHPVDLQRHLSNYIYNMDCRYGPLGADKYLIKKAMTKSSSTVEPMRPASAPCNAAKLFFYPFSFSFHL